MTTNKPSDNYFFAALTISFCLFTLEIVTTTIVIDDFKYSFFFYLDIIATLSLINDIPWLLNRILYIIGQSPDYESVNAIPGVLYVENAVNGKLAQALTSLRLIRLIRIIKLYKYFLKSQAKKNDDENPNKVVVKKKKKVEPAKDATIPGLPEEPESLFRKETDPTKLGKALSDTNTREVIIAVLLMLMVLPLLAPTVIDFSQEYGIRELFWLGRSNCKIP